MDRIDQGSQAGERSPARTLAERTGLHGMGQEGV